MTPDQQLAPGRPIRAAVFRGPGEPVRVTEVELAPPRPGEVEVAVGPGVTAVSPGDHVVLSWVPACGRCPYCRLGRPAQCQLAAEVIAPGRVLYDGTSRLRIGGEPAYHYLG